MSFITVLIIAYFIAGIVFWTYAIKTAVLYPDDFNTSPEDEILNHHLHSLKRN